MRHTNKSILTVLLGLMMTIALALCAFSSTVGATAKADAIEGGDDFFVYGASIRAMSEETDNEAAIRFHVLVSDTFYATHGIETEEQDVDIYVLYVPKAPLDATGKELKDLTLEQVGENYYSKITSHWRESELEDGYREAIVAFYGLPSSFYDKDLAVTAIAIGKGDLEGTKYYTEQVSGSLAYVAWQSGDSDFDDYRPTYTVEFDTHNGSAVSDIENVVYGTSFSDLTLGTTTKTGYNFVNWYKDSSYTSTVSDSDYIFGDSTIYAKWTATYSVLGGSDATVYKDTTAGAGSFDLKGSHTIAPTLSVTPAETVNYSYSSSATSVATVNSSGVVTPVSNGSATITVTATDSDTGETKTDTVDITVYKYYEIDTEGEFDAIASDATGYYRMTDDIALTGTHSNSIAFSGTLDGADNEITGLSLNSSKGLFYSIEGATIKNVKIVDAVVNNQCGVIAYQSYVAPSVIDNVYVSVKALTGGEKMSGLVGRTWSPYSVSNSVVYLPYTTDTSSGFVRGHRNNTVVTVRDCIFIGGNGQYIGGQEQNDSTISVSGTDIYSATEAHSETWSVASAYKSIYTSNHPIVNLTNDNFVEEITKSSNSGALFNLTEDITSAGQWSSGSTITFNGIFDGNGYSINGLDINWRGGLFSTLQCAVIKNVVIPDVTYSSWEGGVFAESMSSDVFFYNIYLSAKSYKAQDSSSRKVGGFVCSNNGNMLCRDCVVYFPTVADLNGLTIGFFEGKAGNITATAINCVCVGSVGGVNFGYGGTGTTATDSYICSPGKAHATYLNNMSAQNKAAYVANHPAVSVNQSNISSVFDAMTQSSTTGKIYYLTEDIALGKWEKGTTSVFSGLFDGCGHKVTFSGQDVQGFFNTLNGATVENLVLKGVDLTAGDWSGGLARFTAGSDRTFVNNVYIEVTNVNNNKSNGRGSFVSQPYTGFDVANCVVYIKDSNATNSRIGFIKGSRQNVTVNVTNSVFISDTVTEYIGQAGSPVGTINPDANTGIYTTAQVNDTVLAKMTDQNYEAYKGSPRA